MLALLRQLKADFRRLPFYTGLLGLGLLTFLALGLRGTNLFGDDNETPGNELSGPPRAGGHGGFVHGFNHK